MLSTSNLDPDPRSAIRDLFSSSAEHYTTHYEKTYSGNAARFQNRLRLARELAANASGTLLDCAAGTGEITSAILQIGNFQRATLVDLSAEMLKRATERLKSDTPSCDVEIVESDIFEFPIVPDSFDWVLCLGLIAHTGRLDELLRLLGRGIRPGGHLILQSTVLDSFGPKLTRWLTDDRYFEKHGYRINHFTSQEITASARAAGFTETGRRVFGAGYVFMDRIFPWGNFVLEKICSRGFLGRGSERLFLFRKNDGAESGARS